MRRSHQYQCTEEDYIVAVSLDSKESIEHSNNAQMIMDTLLHNTGTSTPVRLRMEFRQRCSYLTKPGMLLELPYKHLQDLATEQPVRRSSTAP